MNKLKQVVVEVFHSLQALVQLKFLQKHQCQTKQQVLEITRQLEEANSLLLRKQTDLDNANRLNVSAIVTLEEKEERINQLSSNVSSLLRKIEEVEQNKYIIEDVNISIDDLKKSLKVSDSYTMELLINYLKIDSFNLVKNIAKTVNKSNFAETAIYIDGALSRNDAFIKVLYESTKNRTFLNRINGKETQITKN